MLSASRWVGCAAIVEVGLAMCVSIAGAQGHWEKAAPFPEPEEELYGAAAGGKMYVMGGYGEGGKPVGMVWEYDSATDKWNKKKTMALPAHHAAMCEYKGKIYVFGGFTLLMDGEKVGWKPIDNAWEYDPNTDNWRALTPMPTKRGSPVAEEVGGKIYVIGGAAMHPGSKVPAVFANEPARSVTTNEVYDPETNKWESRSPLPTARNHAFAGAVNGKIYVIGGRIGSPFITVSSNVDVVEEYDPSTDMWGAIKSRMPTPRSGGGWATYNGKIYTTGGELQTPQYLGAFRAFEAYDPLKNVWEILPPLPSPRHGVAGAVIGNKIHFVSGKITSGGYEEGLKLSTPSHDVFVFDK
jgi:N-acetylneuraminic acid mutarotase